MIKLKHISKTPELPKEIQQNPRGVVSSIIGMIISETRKKNIHLHYPSWKYTYYLCFGKCLESRLFPEAEDNLYNLRFSYDSQEMDVDIIWEKDPKDKEVTVQFHDGDGNYLFEAGVYGVYSEFKKLEELINKQYKKYTNEQSRCDAQI